MTQLQLKSDLTASGQLPNCNSTVAMPQLNSSHAASEQSPTVELQLYTDSHYDYPQRFCSPICTATSTRSVAEATRRESAVALVKDEIKTSTAVQPWR